MNKIMKLLIGNIVNENLLELSNNPVKIIELLIFSIDKYIAGETDIEKKTILQEKKILS
jgi:hypothetical protein